MTAVTAGVGMQRSNILCALPKIGCYCFTLVRGRTSLRNAIQNWDDRQVAIYVKTNKCILKDLKHLAPF